MNKWVHGVVISQYAQCQRIIIRDNEFIYKNKKIMMTHYFYNGIILGLEDKEDFHGIK